MKAKELLPLLRKNAPEEAVGQLRQKPYAVSHLAGGILARPVFQLLNDGERVVQDAVLPRPVNIHHGPDAAGVAFSPLKFQSVLSHLIYPLCSLFII